MSAERHRWSECGDLVAFYLQQHARLPYSVARIAARLGMPEGTLLSLR
jgi:hypothetical protein